MGNIDKAAIGWSIAIVAIGVGIAAMGGSLQGSLPEMTAPVIAAPTISGGSTDDKIMAAKEQIAKEQAEKEKAMMQPKEMAKEPAPVAPKPAPEPAPVAPKPAPEPAPVAPKPATPKTVSVSMPAGTSVPGCETTNECYIPATVSIKKGDTVKWVNDDTAAHTVTSGGPTKGPDGNFDSSLVMGKGEFSHTFNSVGNYDYFCMVHPWMKGVINVS